MIKWMQTEGTLDDSVIHSMENRFGVIFPEDYKACVKLHNGGYPSPDSFGGEDGDSMVFNNLISFTDDYLNMGMFVEEFKEDRVLPFARDPFGNHICFDYRHTDRNPTIVFWDAEEGLDFLEPVCETFTALLDQLGSNEDADTDDGEADVEDDNVVDNVGASSLEETFPEPSQQSESNGGVGTDDFEVTYPPTDAAEIERFEARHGLTLPKDYKAFLLSRNGGKKTSRRFETRDKKVTSSIMMFLPLMSGNGGINLEDQYHKFIDGQVVPDYLLPIGTTLQNSLICVAVQGAKREQVYYCNLYYLEEDRGLLPSYIMSVADSFKEFYDGLFKGE
jgi:cell wall assembly regulator SMI1